MPMHAEHDSVMTNLSVTLWYCTETNLSTVCYRHDSIFQGYRCYKTPRRTPQLWHRIHRGGENLRFLTKVAVYRGMVQDRPMVTMDH